MTVVLDLETTGLDPLVDEILEVGVVGSADDIILDSLVRPVSKRDWLEAQAIHGISPADVATAPTLAEISDQIRSAVAGQCVVIFNKIFDAGFLGDLLDTAAEVRCCMLEFTEFRGASRWISLAKATEYVHYSWPDEAHRAVSDARATLAVWRYLHDSLERQRVDLLRRDIEAQYTADRLNRDFYWRKQRDENLRQYRQSEVISNYWLRSGNDSHWIKRYPGEAEDQFALLLFGRTVASLRLEDKSKSAGLPVYFSRKEIPTHLKPISYFPAQSWLRSELRPAGAFCSKKSAYELYEVAELDRIRAEYLLRFVTKPDKPDCYWLPKSKLKTAGVGTARISKMEPVAEVQNRMYFNWYFLYEVSPAANPDLLHKIRETESAEKANYNRQQLLELKEAAEFVN